MSQPILPGDDTPALGHCRLSVNINKVALVRNSRGGNNPDLLQVARDLERFGAEGITVHPRPDERHIRYSDVPALKQVVTTEFNIEGYPDRRWLDMVIASKPDQATLVPDPPGALTSNAGWNTVREAETLKPIIQELKEAGVRVSIFVDPDPVKVEGAAKIGADRVELYTESYATHYAADPEAAVAPFVAAAQAAERVGLGLNAGHDLNLDNLRFLRQRLPNLIEVSIGHALVCDALYYGFENVVRMYRYQLQG